MRSLSNETRHGLLTLCSWLPGWGLATTLLALLAPSFAITFIGLTLLNTLVIRLALRSRAIPGGQDTEWSDVTRRSVHHATPPPRIRQKPAPLPPTRPLGLGGQPSTPDGGGIAMTQQTYIYDN